MLYRRLVSGALVSATVLFLVVNILHPKEYTRDHEAQQLREIAAHYTRWQLAHFLTFVSIGLFLIAILGLGRVLITRRPRQAVLGGVLSLFGLIAISGVLALDGFTWGVLGEVSTFPSSDPHTMQVTLHAVQQSHWNLPFYVGALAWLIGLVILALGLIRERVVPTLAGGVFAVGAVLVGIEAAVENNVYFIVAAAVLAVGGVGVAMALARLDDAEFAI